MNLVLIDGKSVFYRGYHAMGPLATSDGTPTGGVYGFAAIAMEIVKRLSPYKVVVAWDSKTSTAKRRAIYPEYKAGRVKPGEDFYAQIPLLKELVSGLSWELVEIEEYEADDIIGTLSRQADEKGEIETFIISSDLDMLQIVDENTHMLRIVKGFTNIERINVKELEEKYGIRKEQFLDLKALKGDSSDNIPGVAGVGEKTAAALLNEFGTLEGIYENLEKVKPTVRAKLEAGRESAVMSKRLAKIMFDAPVALDDISEFKFDEEKTVKALKKLEFNSLIRKLEKDLHGPSENLAGEAGDLHGNDTGGGNNWERDLHGPGTETSEGGADFARIWKGAEAKKQGENTDLEFSEEEIAEKLTEKPENLLISWNMKGLMHENAGVAKEILAGEREFWDLSQAAFLIDPARKIEPALVVPEEEYARELLALEKMPRVLSVYRLLDLPVIPVLFKMEKMGMMIDREYFKALEVEFSAEVKRLEGEIHKLSGREFNVNSPVQLSEVLFMDLGLPTKGIKKTSRGYSTGAKELEKLREMHPVVPKIIEYREAAKLLSTYIIPMPNLADENGRIHTTFTENVTSTGRLSSINPNLQNIPVRTEEGRRIRTGFVAPEGKVFVSADYSQFELRLAAVLASDMDLISDFNSGVDIHTKTAAEAFHVPIQEVTKQQRRAAKAINFGIIYGMSARGLSEAADMSFSEAKEFIDNYFKLRAPIKKMLDGILVSAREKGYTETFYGRRAPACDINSPNFVVRNAAERAAMNMPIQGTEADLMKRAMIKVDRRLPEGADMVMQVHDSLIVECDEGKAEEISQILKETMEGVAPELQIALKVEVTTGKNWGML